MANEWLSIDEVADKLDVSVPTIRRWWYSGNIIPPVRLSKRCLRWHAGKLQLWLQTRSGAPPERKTEAEVSA